MREEDLLRVQEEGLLLVGEEEEPVLGIAAVCRGG